MSDITQHQPVKLHGGLVYEDMVLGQGVEVASGDAVLVHYHGTLLDGTVFDSSYERNQPFTAQIGVGQVITGWDEGIPGMKTGGKRKLTIPSSMAYGDRDIPGIPGGSTLVFEVEVLEIFKMN